MPFLGMECWMISCKYISECPSNYCNVECLPVNAKQNAHILNAMITFFPGKMSACPTHAMKNAFLTDKC